jgi:hypothetical protein
MVTNENAKLTCRKFFTNNVLEQCVIFQNLFRSADLRSAGSGLLWRPCRSSKNYAGPEAPLTCRLEVCATASRNLWSAGLLRSANLQSAGSFRSADLWSAGSGLLWRPRCSSKNYAGPEAPLTGRLEVCATLPRSADLWPASVLFAQ